MNRAEFMHTFFKLLGNTRIFKKLFAYLITF